MGEPGFYWYEGDYLRDTAHLTNDEDLAYRRLLGCYYSRGGPLPADIKRLQQMARVPLKAVQVVADEFLKIGEDGLRHNPKADRVLSERKSYSDAQAMRAHMRWHKQTHMPSASLGNAYPLPLPIKKEKGICARKRALPSPEKDRFLRFVLLTPAEREKLSQKLNGKAEEMIERLDGYIGQIGEKKAAAKYRSHYDTILNWWRKDHAQSGPEPDIRADYEGGRGRDYTGPRN